MKTKILRKTVVSIFVLVGLATLLAAGTRDSRGFVRVGDALPFNIIVVANTNDSGPGSLRDALGIANDGDTIDATGVSGTILLTSGELQITHNVTINGPGAGNLAVNGNAILRVFENFASDATISGFTITNGFTTDVDGGGGILNHGGLTLSGTSILSNNAGSCGAFSISVGGGINSLGGGQLTVTNSVISNNAAGYGGGISNLSGTMTVSNSTISGNSAGNNGGGIYNKGFRGRATLTVTNCIVSGNSTTFIGGGISNGADEGGASLTIANSTICGNSADNGGGIGNAASEGDTSDVTVSNSTLSGNWATDNGGGIYNGYAGGSVTLELSNIILNAGSSGENIFNIGGTVTSHGYNLSSDDGGGYLTATGDQINTDPMLGPLQDNGGPTFTHALLPGSPAINAGNPSFTRPPFFDQRGSPFNRLANGRIDIGSFEVQVSRASPTPRPRLTPPPRP
jgi:hypothetical protein